MSINIEQSDLKYVIIEYMNHYGYFKASAAAGEQPSAFRLSSETQALQKRFVKSTLVGNSFEAALLYIKSRRLQVRSMARLQILIKYAKLAKLIR